MLHLTKCAHSELGLESPKLHILKYTREKLTHMVNEGSEIFTFGDEGSILRLTLL